MPPRKYNPDDEILVAKQSGVVTVGPDTFYFRQDITRIRAGHPAAKAAAHMLGPIDVHYEWERAVDDPDQPRGT